MSALWWRLQSFQLWSLLLSRLMFLVEITMSGRAIVLAMFWPCIITNKFIISYKTMCSWTVLWLQSRCDENGNLDLFFLHSSWSLVLISDDIRLMLEHSIQILYKISNIDRAISRRRFLANGVMFSQYFHDGGKSSFVDSDGGRRIGIGIIIDDGWGSGTNVSTRGGVYQTTMISSVLDLVAINVFAPFQAINFW